MVEQNGNAYQFGILGCFGDFKICLLSFFVPCYVLGKNAEHFGEDCLIHGLLACIGLYFGPTLRWRLRQEKNLRGSMLMDTVFYTFIPCCALAQDAREIGWSVPKSVSDLKHDVESSEMNRQ